MGSVETDDQPVLVIRNVGHFAPLLAGGIFITESLADGPADLTRIRTAWVSGGVGNAGGQGCGVRRLHRESVDHFDHARDLSNDAADQSYIALVSDRPCEGDDSVDDRGLHPVSFGCP